MVNIHPNYLPTDRIPESSNLFCSTSLKAGDKYGPNYLSPRVICLVPLVYLAGLLHKADFNGFWRQRVTVKCEVGKMLQPGDVYAWGVHTLRTVAEIKVNK